MRHEKNGLALKLFQLQKKILFAHRTLDAARRLRVAAEADPFNAALGYAEVSYAALLDRDREGASAALTGLESRGSHGAMVKLAKRRTMAGIAALDGRLDEALGGFEAVVADYRGLELPFAVATTDLMMVSLLDGSAPEVAAAADEARAIFERLGARAWLDRLDEALTRGQRPSQAPAPSSSSR